MNEPEAKQAERKQAESLKQVLFLETVTTKEAKPQTFKEGEVYSLPDESANHWVHRGKAEAVDEEGRRNPKPLAAGELSPEVRKHQERLKAKKEEEAKAAEKAAEGEPANKESIKRSPLGAARTKAELDAMTIEELRQLAHKENINLHGATTKDDIVKAIQHPKA